MAVLTRLVENLDLSVQTDQVFLKVWLNKRGKGLFELLTVLDAGKLID